MEAFLGKAVKSKRFSDSLVRASSSEEKMFLFRQQWALPKRRHLGRADRDASSLRRRDSSNGRQNSLECSGPHRRSMRTIFQRAMRV